MASSNAKMTSERRASFHLPARPPASISVEIKATVTGFQLVLDGKLIVSDFSRLDARDLSRWWSEEHGVC